MKAKEIYSTDKVLAHPNQLANAMGCGKEAPPAHVHLVLSDLCNADCHFCAYRISGFTQNELFSIGELAKTGTNNPKRMIPNTRALMLIDELSAAGVKAVELTGGGEPTVHPKFHDVCERILKKGMELAVVTNGVNLKYNSIRLLGESATWLRVSVDAPNAEEYSKVRRVSKTHWDSAWKNIASLARYKRATVGVGYVVTRENWDGMVEFMEHAVRAGVHNVRFSAMVGPEAEGQYLGEYNRIQDGIAKATDIANLNGISVFNGFEPRLREMAVAGDQPFDRCAYQYFTTYIGGDMNIYRCCQTSYNELGKLESVAHQTFQEAWSKSQEKMRTFDPRGKCQQCKFSAQNQKVYTLNSAMPHKNFV